jgi:hypothetical protein
MQINETIFLELSGELCIDKTAAGQRNHSKKKLLHVL